MKKHIEQDKLEVVPISNNCLLVSVYNFDKDLEFIILDPFNKRKKDLFQMKLWG